MEMFKKYMPHISLGAGVLILILMFLPAISIRNVSGDHDILGFFVAFGSNSASLKLSMNLVLLLSFLLPIIAGLLHFFTRKSEKSKLFQFISVGLFVVSGGLFFSAPALFDAFVGELWIDNVLINTYITNYGLGIIFAAVFSLLTALTSVMTAFIIE